MSLDKEKLAYFKKRLEQEQEQVEKELSTVGHKNPSDPNDWMSNPDEMDIMEADRNEVADRNEERIDNESILNELEIRLNRVKRALEKIDAGTYGRCEVSGEPIPVERLEANPAALTTAEHETKLHQ